MEATAIKYKQDTRDAGNNAVLQSAFGLVSLMGTPGLAKVC